MSRTLVVGVDAGATSTRCVVAGLDGRIVARGGAGGANQNSSGAGWAGPLGQAMSAALSTVDCAEVAAGVVGVAGAGAGGRAAARAAVSAAWRQAGLAGDPVTVTDLEVAFAAGTPAPDGALLLSGTGAGAVRLAGGVPVRRCDGYGWLLGDEGSAVWIGVRGLRAVLAALDGRGLATALVTALSEQLGVPDAADRAAHAPLAAAAHAPLADAGHAPLADAAAHGQAADREALAQALLAVAYAAPPAALGRLAPAVGAAATAGDPVARGITHGAADRLLHALATVEPAPGRPVVLAGSVLLGDGPVAAEVRAAVAARYGVAPDLATDGAAGAAALAIARLRGGPLPEPVHSRLTSGHDRG